MTIQRRVFISGRVQGVGFRASTVKEVGRFGDLRGYVRNLEDGRVEVVFQGPPDQVLAMVAWCKSGPPSAQVREIQVIEESLESGLKPFART